MPASSKSHDYPDDIFADTRMSFGDHIEELRVRLIRAIAGLAVILIGGFILDMIGQSLGLPNLGMGRPMMGVIVEPVESQVGEFYATWSEEGQEKFLRSLLNRPDEAEIERVRQKYEAAGRKQSALTSDEIVILRGTPKEMPVILPVEPFVKVFGTPKDPSIKEIEVKMSIYPAQLDYLAKEGERLLQTKKYLTTLSVQEAFVVYFKVSLLCGVVVGSPWIFYQIWAFIAAGLYPHERAYVYRFLGPSIGLFLSGVMVCQFLVLPGAVKALLAFNGWIGLDPELRLNEWLGFALILPLVFGISFQTPLAMFVMNRLGTFSAQDYARHWRGAVMTLAIFSAIITPTPDAVTLMYLFIPMFTLYMLGVGVCYFFPPPHEAAWEEDESNQQVAV